jgi:hypothetical protein
MHRLVARRVVLARAAAVFAALPAAPAVAAHNTNDNKKTLKAFHLVTGCKAHGGCACNACQAHAANKLFASQTHIVRAHIGCNCKVEKLDLPRNVWVALFGLPAQPTSLAVDKRDPRVQQILAHAPSKHHHAHH